MEVLGASFVIVIALVGVGMAMTQAAKKSGAPHKVELAAMLASERLAYFRSQPDPFRAAGGTHYIFTTNSAGGDLNTVPNANNAYNTNPVLFVREYLFAADEGQQINVLNGVDDGRANQRLRTFRGPTGAGSATDNNFTINQVPPTRAGADRVYRSVDVKAPAPPAIAPGIVAIPAPRANANLPGAAGTPIPPTVTFIREVWVQTNHLLHTTPTGGNPPLVVMPDPAANLPPYTVAVTVKVFARDPKTQFYIQNPAASTVPYRDAQWRGPGYDPTKPLAVMSGYFGLRRNMN